MNGGEIKETVRELIRFPNVSLDFVNDARYFPREPAFVIGTKERQLVEDLLCCFVGVQGYYIQAEPISYPFEVRKFTISDEIDPTYRSLVERLLPLATCYSTVARFVERNRRLDAGRVNQSLSADLDAYLAEFQNSVVDLDLRHRREGLDLTTLWAELQDAGPLMNLLAQVCYLIEKSDARGGRTLSILHIEATRALSDKQQIFVKLAKAASRPFMDSLSRWVYRGIVYDPYDEFMVEVNKRLDTNKTKSQYPDGYWNNRFYLKEDRIPCFLLPVKHKVLAAGKFLDVIRKSPVDKENILEIHTLNYSIKIETLLERIEMAYNYASKALLSMMLHDFNIMEQIKTVKTYFLLEKGDFFVKFMDRCEDELSRGVKDVCCSFLSEQLKYALGQDLKFIKMSFVLEKRSLRNQVEKITCVDRPEEQNDLKGIDAFSLYLKRDWPVSLLFNHKICTLYQILFRTMFITKYSVRKLSRAGMRKDLPAEAYALKHSMLCLLQSLLYLMTYDTTLAQWKRFLQEVTKTTSWDQVMNLHWEFLMGCLEGCLLTSSVSALCSLVDTALGFSDLLAGEAETITPAELQGFKAKFKSATSGLVNAVGELPKRDMDPTNRISFDSFFTEISG